MQTETSQERAASYATCVADIRELCVEFQRAIALLASNDVSNLEAVIEKQEDLANRLQEWFRSKPSIQAEQVRISTADLRELINLTRVYSSLLTSSIRTVRLRTALCRTYQQQFPAAVPQPEATTPSLSCEV